MGSVSLGEEQLDGIGPKGYEGSHRNYSDLITWGWEVWEILTEPQRMGMLLWIGMLALTVGTYVFIY